MYVGWHCSYPKFSYYHIDITLELLFSPPPPPPPLSKNSYCALQVSCLRGVQGMGSWDVTI